MESYFDGHLYRDRFAILQGRCVLPAFHRFNCLFIESHPSKTMIRGDSQTWRNSSPLSLAPAMIPAPAEKEPNMKLKWYGVLFSSIVFVVAFCGAADTAQSHGQLYERWLAEAKARYANQSSKPGQPQRVSNKNQLQSSTTTCIAEVNAASPTDISCTVPSEGYYAELFIKNGADGDQGWNWKPCDNASSVTGSICPGANATWYINWPLPEENGQYGIQERLVPFTSCNGNPCVVRGRMIVTFGKLKSSIEKQKP